MKTYPFSSERILLARLERGDDLLEALQALCSAQQVRAGVIHGIGAVERAVIGYYDQQAGRYDALPVPHAMEIANLQANVSIKDGEPFVHAHVTLAGPDGRCLGGHLMPGTVVFACELQLRCFEGEAPQRGLDELTGLALWG
jgi:predicted DNA-binding protein with PD1-like motif